MKWSESEVMCLALPKIRTNLLSNQFSLLLKYMMYTAQIKMQTICSWTTHVCQSLVNLLLSVYGNTNESIFLLKIDWQICRSRCLTTIALLNFGVLAICSCSLYERYFFNKNKQNYGPLDNSITRTLCLYVKTYVHREERGFKNRLINTSPFL